MNKTRFRKCDTEKYRRRRKKDRIAHLKKIERLSRLSRENAERHRIAWQQREVYLANKREYRQQAQALVNVLARHLYKLSPEHAAKARFRDFFQMVRLFDKSGRISDILDRI